MAGRVLIGDDVRDKVDAAVLHRASQVDVYRCLVCGLKGSVAASEDAAVLLLEHTDATSVSFAHASCGESQVITTGQPSAAPSATDDVISLAGLLPSAFGIPQPTLMIEPEMPGGYLVETGDLFDPWLSSLLEGGLTLVDRVDRAPGAPTQDGWSVSVDSTTSTGSVTGPDGAVLLDTLPSLPPGWVEAAGRIGSVRVFAGNLGIAAHEVHQITPDTLNDAARLGRTVGGDLPVIVTAGPMPHPVQDAAASLANSLTEVLESRAGRPGPLTDRPSIVDLPTSPRLVAVALAQDTSAILVDLADPDLDRGRATLARFEELGLPRRYKIDDGMLAEAHGWGFVLWRSQVVFLGPDRDGDGGSRKVLFEKYPPSGPWFAAVAEQAHRLGYATLALMVLNTGGGDLGPDRIESEMARGGVLTAVMAGMISDGPDRRTGSPS